MKFQVFHVNPGEKLKKKMLITILAILCQSFLMSTVQNRHTFKSTTNKSTFEYAFITIIVKVHLFNLLQT